MKINQINHLFISFIIPAYNEELIIEKTLDSIRRFTPKKVMFEIIVVDNCSTDRTCDIAQKNGAIVIENIKGTIAFLRNFGVERSRGSILVFLDADVLLTERWSDEIILTIGSLKKNPIQVTGSRCHIEDIYNWLERYWFDRMRFDNNKNYINSGHLITTRELFYKVGGFSSELKTSEDCDFSYKSIQCGAKIVPNNNLITIHTGYPKTVKTFVNRERWHGYEDFLTLHKMIGSKISILVTLNTIIASFMIFFFLMTLNIKWILVYILFFISLSAAFTIFKFGLSTPWITINSTLIGTLYILGRTLALFDRIRCILPFFKKKIPFDI